MGLDPTVAELNCIETINDAAVWCGIAPGLLIGLRKAMGQLWAIRDVVLIRPRIWEATLPKVLVFPDPPAAAPDAGGTGAAADTEGADAAAAAGADSGGAQSAAAQPAPAEEVIPPEGRPLMPVEYGQLDGFRRVCRLRMGLPAEDEPAAGAPPTLVSPGGAGSTAAVLPLLTQGAPSSSGGPMVLQPIIVQQTKKTKMSAVFDQGDSNEFEPWTEARYQTILAAFKVLNEGEDAKPHEEASKDQLAALEHRLNTGSAPAADFAIWRPHGLRFMRALKLQGQAQQSDGTFVQREVQAPASFKEWLAAWRVFQMAMRALGAASGAKLELYEDHIRSLADRYHAKFWWLVAQADARMRSERWERIRREAQEQKAECSADGRPHAYDPARPWDYVIKAATKDTEFWRIEVSEKVSAFNNHLASMSELADPGFGKPTFADGGAAQATPGGNNFKRNKVRQPPKHEQGAGKGGRNGKGYGGKSSGKGAKSKQSGGKGAKGKYNRTADNKNQICWAYNEAHGGCSKPCPASRAHVCSLCLDKHRAVECPTSS